MADSDQVTSTVEDSQDASKETLQTIETTNASPSVNDDVSSSSPAMPLSCADDSSDPHQQLSSKEKLAKFSFEQKSQ